MPLSCTRGHAAVAADAYPDVRAAEAAMGRSEAAVRRSLQAVLGSTTVVVSAE
jgi:hypothetical protein